MLNLLEFVKAEAELRKDVPGDKATASDVSDRVLRTGTGSVVCALEVARIMEEHGGQRDLTIALTEVVGRSGFSLDSGQQVQHGQGCLHRVIEIVKRGVARMKPGDLASKKLPDEFKKLIA